MNNFFSLSYNLSKQHWLILHILLLVLIFFLYTDYTKIHPKHLTFHFLDIGQGDATLIITPQNQKILIDTGPPGNLNKKLKKYLSFFDKTIDLFILTHPDSDHIGDFENLLKNYQLKQIIFPTSIQNKTEYQNLIIKVQNKNIPYLFANTQKDLKINNNLFIDFLYPFPQSSIQKQNSFSNASLVFKIIHGKNTFLFTGDAEKEQEKLILISSQNLKSNLYQAGHHGSKSSSTERFIQSIQAETSIISAGKNNKFGHPHLEIIDRFNYYKMKIHQTAIEEDIIIYSNEENFWNK